jgi:hypothetical protein
VTPVTPLTFVGYALLQSLVICAIVVSLCDLCRRVLKHDDLLTFCAAVLALGVLGYLSFWLAFLNYAVFGVVKIAVLAALLLNLGIVVVRRRIGDYAWLAEPLLFTVMFVVGLLMLGLSNGGFNHPPGAIATRFGFDMPSDNEIPMIVAEAVRVGRIPSPLFEEWLASDRPPLQTGLYFLLVLKHSWHGYQVVASFLQATFLFGVWGVLAGSAIPPASRRLTLLACCLLPASVFNTLYTWPKLLAASYLLLLFALLFLHRSGNDREAGTIGVLMGGFSALAFLSHGSSAFA